MIVQDAVNLIKHFESLHDGDPGRMGLQPKLCPAGIWTVGWGRALRHPDTKEFLRGLEHRELAYQLYPSVTIEQAEQWLREDIEEFETHVRRYVTVPLSDNQLGALVSFVYNIGQNAFARSTLLRKLNSGDYLGAANEFSRWNKANGKILNGLIKRRAAERELFLRPVQHRTLTIIHNNQVVAQHRIHPQASLTLTGDVLTIEG